LLTHLGLPPDAPELAPARAPPQAELFGGNGTPLGETLDSSLVARGL
jgi:hypothetical protein